MHTILFDEGGLFVFLLVTVFLGGSGAFATGKAMANNWHEWPMLVVALFGLGFAVRFIHFSLFQEKLLVLVLCTFTILFPVSCTLLVI